MKRIVFQLLLLRVVIVQFDPAVCNTAVSEQSVPACKDVQSTVCPEQAPNNSQSIKGSFEFMVSTSLY